MAITITVKKWRAARPLSAKGSGVAKAIDAVGKACSKPVKSMTSPQLAAAQKAVDGLKKALKTGNTKIKADKKAKDRSKILGLIAGWTGECDGYKTVLDYQIKVDSVTTSYHRNYMDNRDRLDRAHAAAKVAAAALRSRNEVPAGKQLMEFTGAARAASKFCSKQGIALLPGGNQVKVADILLPKDMKATKTKIKELIVWIDDFSEAAKEKVRAKGAGLDDNKAVEKELKNILAEHRKIEAKMKPVITKSKKLAEGAKKLANVVKVEIGKPTVDHRLFKKLTSGLDLIARGLNQASADVESINKTWRAKGALANQQSDFRKMVGYDAGKHYEILQNIISNQQLTIRRVTLMTGEGGRQVKRAIRLMSDSTSHRGLALKITKVP